VTEILEIILLPFLNINVNLTNFAEIDVIDSDSFLTDDQYIILYTFEIKNKKILVLGQDFKE
jgi:hypothetical protein